MKLCKKGGNKRQNQRGGIQTAGWVKDKKELRGKRTQEDISILLAKTNLSCGIFTIPKFPPKYLAN